MAILIFGHTTGTGSTVPQWLATAGAATHNERAFGITAANNDEIYVAGEQDTTGTDYPYILKYDGSGTVQWQKYLSFSGTIHEFQDVAVDPSGNVYAVGRFDTTTDDWLVTKWNSSGSLQWQRYINDASNSIGAEIVGTDSSGNVYVGGSGNGHAVAMKFNTSGTLQWQRQWNTNGNPPTGGGVDSSGNFYLSSSVFVGPTISMATAKWNTSGVLQWQQNLTDSAHLWFTAGHTGSTGSTCVVGNTSANNAFAALYNSSGVLQWNRTLGGGSSDRYLGAYVDSSDNVYLVGETQSAGQGIEDILMAKYNSSGVLQWQRLCGGTGGDIPRSVTHDGSNSVIVTGYTNTAGEGALDMLIFKTPDDGSMTGTIGSYTYQTASLTEAAGTASSATGSLTEGSSSLTDSAGGMSEQTGNLTSTLQ